MKPLRLFLMLASVFFISMAYSIPIDLDKKIDEISVVTDVDVGEVVLAKAIIIFEDVKLLKTNAIYRESELAVEKSKETNRHKIIWKPDNIPIDNSGIDFQNFVNAKEILNRTSGGLAG